MNLLAENNYSKARKIFSALGSYSESPRYTMYCSAIVAGEAGYYSIAVENLKNLTGFLDSNLLAIYYTGLGLEAAEDFEDAAEVLSGIGLYRDVSARLTAYPELINARDYRKACSKEDSGNLEGALSDFMALGDYEDSAEHVSAIREKIKARDYAEAEKAEEKNQLETALAGFVALGDYSDSIERAATVQEKIYSRDYDAADKAEKANKLEDALAGFEALDNYSDSAERAVAVQEKIYARDYDSADLAEKNEDYISAYNGFVALGEYKDSAERAAAVQDKGNYAQALLYALNGSYDRAYELFKYLGDYEDSEAKAYATGVTEFASLKDCGKGTAKFQFHGVWGIIDISTNTTIAPYWDSIESFNEYDLALVTKDNNKGYINRQGEIIIPCEYSDLSSFDNNGLCTSMQYNSDLWEYNFGLIDYTGTVITDCVWKELGNSTSYYAYTPSFIDGKTKVKNNDGQWGFLDLQGNGVGEIRWNNIEDFKEGFAVVSENKKIGYGGTYIKKEYGYIDSLGQILIEPQYNDAHSFFEGMAWVKTSDNLWQCIDCENNIIIPARYTDITEFNNGLADVCLDGEWQIIDTEGNIVYFKKSERLAEEEASHLEAESLAAEEAARYEAERKTTITYTTVAGDTLPLICEKLGIDYESNRGKILAINGIQNENEIKLITGWVLIIPMN